MEKNLSIVLEDILKRIERLNKLIHKHQELPTPDTLAIEGYQKLKEQYKEQLNELLAQFELKVENHSKAA
ncbi:MAG: hypothetical protein ACK4NY_02165 [Spirosomataceae bacterium]